MDKLVVVNLKSGALVPTFGNSPLVFTGFPLNNTDAINVIYLSVKSSKNI
jgi:hypothetical protein